MNKHKISKFTAYIPGNLDLRSHLINNPPPDGLVLKLDRLAYILGSISRELYYNRKTVFKEGYASLSSEILKKVIGSSYTKYLSYLESTGIIEISKQYIVGEKSRGYMFTPLYLTFSKPYKITEGFLNEKIDRHLLKNLESSKKQLPYLYKWIRSLKLTIDAEGTEAILKMKYEEKLKERKSPNSQLNKKQIADLSLDCWKRSIRILAKKEYKKWFTIDTNGGRLHTVLTTTSRDFRRFINYGDQTLVHVDISNAQPYLITKLLDPLFWFTNMLDNQQRRLIKEKMMPELEMFGITNMQITQSAKKIKIQQSVKTNISYKKYYTILMLLISHESKVQREFQDFKNCVSEGRFYEFMLNRYKKALNHKSITRVHVKKWMLEVLFSNNPLRDFERPQYKVFRETFPYIEELLRYIKNEKYNTLALLLQNLESDVVLHRICFQFAQKHPEIPLFTIHDCIVTTKGNEGLVSQLMCNSYYLI